jgi:hypothetical protein
MHQARPSRRAFCLQEPANLVAYFESASGQRNGPSAGETTEAAKVIVPLGALGTFQGTSR